MKISNKSFQNVVKFKEKETTTSNQNFFFKELLGLSEVTKWKKVDTLSFPTSKLTFNIWKSIPCLEK
jgi:hypothetical protein